MKSSVFWDCQYVTFWADFQQHQKIVTYWQSQNGSSKTFPLRYAKRNHLGDCKGNCGRSGGRKRHAGSVTSRGSKVSLLLIGRLHMAAYLAGDPKRKE